MQLMKSWINLFVISFLFTVFPMNSNCQSFTIEIEEVESKGSEQYMGGGNSVFIAQYPLKNILSYCISRTGRGMPKAHILLKENPVIQLKAINRDVFPEHILFQRITEQLMERYDLCYRTSEKEKSEVLLLNSLERYPLPDQKSGGTQPHSNGGFTLSNMYLSSVCWWFAHHGIVVQVEDRTLVDELRVTIEVPAAVVAQMPGNQAAVEALLNQQGVFCTLVTEPTLRVVSKVE